MSDWAVIIPSARIQNLVFSVGSILCSHPGLDPSRIVIVDDGARKEGEHMVPAGVTWVDGVKPFVFSRNINLGVKACGDARTFILLNDDAEVLSLCGFDLLSDYLRQQPQTGILSAGIQGTVGNERQRFKNEAQVTDEPQRLVFICVAISRAVWERVGPLDERFVGYGCEDDDYSWRVRRVGLSLRTHHRCVVRHDGSIPSTYRTRPDVDRLFNYSRELFYRKWNVAPIDGKFPEMPCPR